jgi:cell division protein YceG involved in septum cleavage
MFLAGLVLSLAAAGALWLLSADTSGLPPADEDLSGFNRFYLRAYLRINADILNAPSARFDGIFEIQQGESVQSICSRLEAEGWVPSSELIVNYFVYTGGDRKIGSGIFLLRAGQNTREIADALVSGKSKVRSLTVFPVGVWRR